MTLLDYGPDAVIMKGLGHFPMSENPAEFFKYLLPVLDKIGSMELPVAAKKRAT